MLLICEVFLLLLLLVILDFITTNPQRQLGFDLIIAAFYMPGSHHSLSTIRRTYCGTVGERAYRCPPNPQIQTLGEQCAGKLGILDLSFQPALNKLIIKFTWFVYPAHIDINKRGHLWEAGESQTSVILTCVTVLSERSCFRHPG